MKTEKVINELFHQGIIQSKNVHCETLQGGTASELYLLQDSTNAQCVIKFNEPEVLKAEAAFLDCYNHLSLIPTLLYAESSHRYIVYSFISGTTQLTGINKQILLRTLTEEVLNQYKNVGADNGFGFIDERHSYIGSELMQKLEEKLKAENIHHMYLSTVEEKEGPEAFFQKQGYHTNEKRIIMEKYL